MCEVGPGNPYRNGLLDRMYITTIVPVKRAYTTRFWIFQMLKPMARSSTLKAHQARPALFDSILEWGIFAITLPYYLLYARTTKSRIVAVCKLDDDQEIRSLLQRWLTTKYREAQYVQVAGAVTFASAISSLSWTDLTGRHWSGPTCWYASIVLSLCAVISGAQQTILLGSLVSTTVKEAKRHLCKGIDRPNWVVVFAWQSPLMFLTYALIFFIGGLTSYIASPVAQNPAWNDEAKSLLFYAIVAIAAFAVFVSSSRLVHQTLPEAGEDCPPDSQVITGDSLNLSLISAPAYRSMGA